MPKETPVRCGAVRERSRGGSYYTVYNDANPMDWSAREGSDPVAARDAREREPLKLNLPGTTDRVERLISSLLE
jgi:hypothetical protein